MLQAHVVGAGPAGCLAALLLHDAGWEVCLYGEYSSSAPHVHIVDLRLVDIAAALLPSVGIRLSEQVDQNWAWQTGEKPCTGPRLARDDVCNILSLEIEERGIPRGVFWTVDEAAKTDLIVDATGGVRSVFRELDCDDVLLDAADALETYESWQFATTRPDHRTYRDPTCYLYIEQAGQSVTLTQLSDEPLSDGMERAELVQRILGVETVAKRHKPILHRVPVFSQLVVPPDLRAPVIGFGDSLVQASPRTGFGLLSIFQQGKILQSWMAAGGSLPELRSKLDSYASAVVVNMATRDLI